MELAPRNECCHGWRKSSVEVNAALTKWMSSQFPTLWLSKVYL
jgi:hypothetical protein